MGEIDPNDVRTAQMMTGALLWLSTRTRPDLIFGVSAMSRLTTKNPKKAVEIGYVLLKYLYGNPGGMHYPQTIPGGDWGRRDQLKARRHQKMLEVFSDISYAAGADHKSIQGLVVYYAGVPIAWQCGVQPFVAHSTAEAELIAYCESLVVGRATETLLASIWQQWDFEKVIYGDNAAAINLAHGVTTASWRTRHLRIRASVLKEALDETNRNRGGGWKLLHLKGTELVADGCTKPLQGQAFTQFVDDLGLRRTRREHRHAHEDRPAVGGEHHGAAMRAMMVGGVLLSTAEAHKEENDEVFDRVWTAGILLMALGAIYAGQLVVGAARCCLRRMQRSNETNSQYDLGKPTTRSRNRQDVLVNSEDEETLMSENDGEPFSLRVSSRSGSEQASTGKRGATSRTRSMPMSAGASTSLKSSSSSGLHAERAATSGCMSSSSGLHAERAATSGCMTLSSGLQSSASGSISKGMTLSSGSHGECFAAGSQATSRSTSTQSGFKQRGGSSITEQRGASSAAGFGAATSPSTASGSASVSEAQRSPKEKDLSSPWNRFQRENRGKGLSKTTLAKIYQYEKAKHNKDN